MASSGSVVTSAYKGMKVRFYWRITETDVFSNTSTVQWTAVCEGSPSGVLFPKVKKIFFSQSGTNRYENPEESFENGKTLAVWSKTVCHDDAGNHTAYITARASFESLSTNATAEYKGSITLPHIPRASTFTIGDTGKYFGNSYSAQITSESADFSHSIDLKLHTASGDVTYTVAHKTNSLTPTMTLNLDWCSHAPNNQVISAEFVLNTWIDDEIMGSRSIHSYVLVPMTVLPAVTSFTITDATTGLADQFDGFVEGKSTVSWSVTAQGAFGSTIKSYEIQLPNQVYTTASGTSNVLNYAGNYNATATVTDSRGRTATASIATVVYPYGAPSIAVFTPFRTSDGVTEDDNGTILGIDLDLSVFDVDNRNPVSFGIGYRLADSNGSFTVLQHTIPANSYAYNNVQIFSKTGDPTFSVDNSYEIRLAITDYFGTTYKYAKIATGVTVFDIYQDGTGVCFGGVSQNRKEFRVTGKKSFFDGGLFYSANAIASGDDLDDVTMAGFYFGDPGSSASHSIGNSPAYDAPIVLEVFDTGTAAKMQRVTVCDGTTPVVFVRFYASSAWSAWVSV